MTTYNTGNPIGSADPRDLYDNAQVVDDYANSETETTTDRLGVERATIAGIDAAARAAIANAGYEFVGDYAAGIELTAYNQVVREAGEFWRVSGAIDLPYTTTGAGMAEGGAFVSVGDATLREEFVAHEESTGDVHGIPVGERALHTGETPDFPAMPTVAGTPVVESGSNSDGEWTRWADGTQICTIRWSATIPVNIGTGSGFSSERIEWIYPYSFAGFVFGSLTTSSGLRMGGMHMSDQDRAFATLKDFEAAGSIRPHLMATGRWK